MDKCPKCGGIGGIEINLRTQGVQLVHYDFKGEAHYCNQDSLSYKQPKFGKCLDCGKKIPNPNNYE